MEIARTGLELLRVHRSKENEVVVRPAPLAGVNGSEIAASFSQIALDLHSPISG